MSACNSEVAPSTSSQRFDEIFTEPARGLFAINDLLDESILESHPAKDAIAIDKDLVVATHANVSLAVGIGDECGNLSGKQIEGDGLLTVLVDEQTFVDPLETICVRPPGNIRPGKSAMRRSISRRIFKGRCGVTDWKPTGYCCATMDTVDEPGFQSCSVDHTIKIQVDQVRPGLDDDVGFITPDQVGRDELVPQHQPHLHVLIGGLEGVQASRNEPAIECSLDDFRLFHPRSPFARMFGWAAARINEVLFSLCDLFRNTGFVFTKSDI